MRIATTGTTATRTSDIPGSSRTAMTIPPIASRGALTKILMRPLAKFCTWVTSFVSLVTSEAFSNRSRSRKAKAWMRR